MTGTTRRTEEILEEAAVRTALAGRVMDLLSADPRVASVTWVGSAGNGGGDRYSDVDIGAYLHPDVSDRAFAEDVPRLLEPVGPFLAEGWGVRVLPGKYVRTLYLAEYPLFWHLDISSVGGIHVDGSDLMDAYHWPRFFKTWFETLKGVVRGKHEQSPEFVETMLGRWLDLPSLYPGIPAPQRLAAYLDLCAERTHAERDERAQMSDDSPLPTREAIERLYRRCNDLRQEYLLPQCAAPIRTAGNGRVPG